MKDDVLKKYWRPKDIAGFDFMSASCRAVNVDFHCHHGFTMSAVECGSLTVYFIGFSVILKPGEILLLGPDVPQAMEGSDTSGTCKYRTLTHAGLNKNPELNRILMNERNSICKIHDKRLWRDFLGEMEESEASEAGQISRIEALSESLLTSLSRNVMWKFEVRSIYVRTAKEYLENNYQEEIGIDELSHSMGLSARHFFRLFKYEMGMTPHHYLVQLKINKARRMICDGFPLLHVAHELGFADQSHFSKTFLKYTGTSPVKYSLIKRKSRN